MNRPPLEVADLVRAAGRAFIERSRRCLLATPRRSTAIADRTRSLPGPGTQRTLALSQVWRPHGGHRETYRGPTPTPFSTLSRRSRRMKPQFQLPPLVHLTTSRRGAPFLPPNQAGRPQPRLKLSPQPHANYHQTNPDCALVRSTPSCRSLSHIPNTIEFA